MPRKIPLPRGWNRRPKAAILQILALRRYALTALLAKAAGSRNQIARVRTEVDGSGHQIALLQVTQGRTGFSGGADQVQPP